MKKIGFMVFAFIVYLNLSAQDVRTELSKDNLPRALKMKGDQFVAFEKTIKDYNTKILVLLNDTTGNKISRNNNLAALRDERALYIRNTLNSNQQKIFSDYEKSFSARSRIKNVAQKNREKIVNQGLRVAIDSTSQK